MNQSELLRQIESDSARRYGVNPKKQIYVVLGTSDWFSLIEAIKPEHSIFVQGFMEGRDFLRLNHFIVIPSMDFVDGFYLTTDYDVGTIMRIPRHLHYAEKRCDICDPQPPPDPSVLGFMQSRFGLTDSE